jgi:hypothetical protein
MPKTASRGRGKPLALAACFSSNRLLATFSPADRAMLEGFAELVKLSRGKTLVNAGDPVHSAYFPSGQTVISMEILIESGRAVQVATIGREGAAGGIVSGGAAPAYARAVVQIPGDAIRIDINRLEVLKLASEEVRNLFSRYADALLAQVMQSVACNAFHRIEARCCRWLLALHDRIGHEDIPLTHEGLWLVSFKIDTDPNNVLPFNLLAR